MTLLEIFKSIYSQEFDDLKTIYAKKPWSLESDAVIEDDPENCLVPPHLAEQGYDYFIEVFIALEFDEGVKQMTPSPTIDQRCQRLIEYATYDA